MDILNLFEKSINISEFNTECSNECIIYEEDCKDYIAYTDYPLEYKNIFSNITKLLSLIDNKTKFKVHRFLTVNLNKLSQFKIKTLLPCYISLYYLSLDNIILSNFGCKYIFKIDIKYKKISSIVNLASQIENNNIDYDNMRNNISYLIKGWCYILTLHNQQNFFKFYDVLYDIIGRIFIFNLQQNINLKIKNIPTHFKIYKKIENYIYIALQLLSYKMHFLIDENIKEMINYLSKMCIKKSHNKISYINYTLEIFKNEYKFPVISNDNNNESDEDIMLDD
ncbi:hypothetical protein MseVgp064 [Melanoplus sanguinipes entomopoxvirus]|uniref:Uncharacterized protein n=1 Tax=Melanoplus sanguinipes entomopoxvirus TaxID=83191 RepID=Q9YW28_MSEPV|nr:hypothetical protein MseVgp064 [Melanoplus sanguinipes entomopoxvirus]AAC97816.1 ORF MSV064 hypothetical protein [Melanoplus sanguinipes entomopoxvirus 'O']